MPKAKRTGGAYLPAKASAYSKGVFSVRKSLRALNGGAGAVTVPQGKRVYTSKSVAALTEIISVAQGLVTVHLAKVTCN
jgi:hypothetical protein